MQDKKALDLSDIGQHGHDHGTRITPAIDGAELKASHAHLAKQSQIHELDSSDQSDATGDMSKYQRTSDDVRGDDQDRFNHGSGTFATPQQNDNVRDTKSGSPSSNGAGNKGGGR